MVRASFNTLVATPTQDGTNDIHRISTVLQNGDNNNATTNVAKSYTEYEQTLANRWKTAGVRASA